MYCVVGGICEVQLSVGLVLLEFREGLVVLVFFCCQLVIRCMWVKVCLLICSRFLKFGCSICWLFLIILLFIFIVCFFNLWFVLELFGVRLVVVSNVVICRFLVGIVIFCSGSWVMLFCLVIVVFQLVIVCFVVMVLWKWVVSLCVRCSLIMCGFRLLLVICLCSCMVLVWLMLKDSSLIQCYIRVLFIFMVLVMMLMVGLLILMQLFSDLDILLMLFRFFSSGMVSIICGFWLWCFCRLWFISRLNFWLVLFSLMLVFRVIELQFCISGYRNLWMVIDCWVV